MIIIHEKDYYQNIHSNDFCENFLINKKKQTASFTKRVDTLRLWLNSALKKQADEIDAYCVMKQLYYDDWSNTENWITVTPFE